MNWKIWCPVAAQGSGDNWQSVAWRLSKISKNSWTSAKNTTSGGYNSSSPKGAADRASRAVLFLNVVVVSEQATAWNEAKHPRIGSGRSRALRTGGPSMVVYASGIGPMARAKNQIHDRKTLQGNGLQ
jgi:hypothetical protein